MRVRQVLSRSRRVFIMVSRIVFVHDSSTDEHGQYRDPLAWPTRIQWVTMSLVLLARDAGWLSIDRWLWRRFGKAFGADANQPARQVIGQGQTKS
jgi:hypothetical protein